MSRASGGRLRIDDAECYSIPVRSSLETGDHLLQNTELQKRWNATSTALGFVAWLGAVIASLANANFLDQIDLLIFFGIAVIAPLAISLIDFPARSRLHARLDSAVVFLQPVTVVLSGVSLLLPVGPSAGVLAGSWLALTGLLALVGLGRLERRLPLAEWCIIIGLVYSPVSGIWFVIHQTWGAFLAFDEAIVLLTAAHFCYIGLGALIIAGLVGRQIRDNILYRISAIGMIASPPLVAIGITLTSFGAGVSPVEKVGVVMLAGSVLLLSIVILFRVRVENRAARWLLRLSAGSLFLTMGLALAYSIGRLISIPDMVQWHGWFNAVGFAFLGLLGWRVEMRKVVGD
jgi:hypothetical protein